MKYLPDPSSSRGYGSERFRKCLTFFQTNFAFGDTTWVSGVSYPHGKNKAMMEYPMYTVPLETLLTLTDFRSHEAKLVLWTWNDGWAETILTSWCILIIHEWMVNVYVNIIVSSWKYDSEHIPKWQVWSGSIFLSPWVVITTGAQESIDDGILIEFHPGTGRATELFVRIEATTWS